MGISSGGQKPGDLGPPFRRRQVRNNSGQGFRNAAPYDSRGGNDSPLWPKYPIKIAKAEEDIQPGDTGVVVVWRNPDNESEPKETNERLRVFYDWGAGPTILEGDEVICFEFIDENLWRVFPFYSNTGVELTRCSDDLTVVVLDIEISEELGKLSDNSGAVVRLAASALLPEDCWTIGEASDCPPSVCPEICFIVKTCQECNGCFKLTRCDDESITKITSPTNMCSGSTSFPFDVIIADGGVVRLDDGHCYLVETSPNCQGSEDVTVVGLADSCLACETVLELQPCYGEIKVPIYIYKDSHDLETGDVIKWMGVCLEVIGEASSNEAIRISGFTKKLDCPSCLCWILRNCDENYEDIVIKSAKNEDGSDFDLEANAGKILFTGDGCYRLEVYYDDCEAAVEEVILTTFDECEYCYLTPLHGCYGVEDIYTYSNMRAYKPGDVIKREQDGFCYEVGNPEANFRLFTGVKVTVEAGPYEDCYACASPCYVLDPICKSCEDIAHPENEECEPEDDPNCEIVAGGTKGQIILADENSLDASFLGKFARYNRVCYYVTQATTQIDEEDCIYLGQDVEGPFDDCETCQEQCLFFVTDVYVYTYPVGHAKEGQVWIKQEKTKIIVDQICEVCQEDIIQIEDCPPEEE